jgi:hypothetical protein
MVIFATTWILLTTPMISGTSIASATIEQQGGIGGEATTDDDSPTTPTTPTEEPEEQPEPSPAEPPEDEITITEEPSPAEPLGPTGTIAANQTLNQTLVANQTINATLQNQTQAPIVLQVKGTPGGTIEDAQQRMVEMINSDPRLTPEQKTQAINALSAQIVQLQQRLQQTARAPCPLGDAIRAGNYIEEITYIPGTELSYGTLVWWCDGELYRYPN